MIARQQEAVGPADRQRETVAPRDRQQEVVAPRRPTTWF